MRVDDLIVWGETKNELVDNIKLVLERLACRAFTWLHTRVRFLDPSISWCGRTYSGAGVIHDPQRIQGLAEMRRPEMIGELNLTDLRLD